LTQETPIGTAAADIAARDAGPPVSIVTWPHTTAWLMRGVQPHAISEQAAAAVNKTIKLQMSFMGPR
jgi:hypothetical protein